MGKKGWICHFARALLASSSGRCSQVLALLSFGAGERGPDNDTFRAVFPSIWVLWDPQTLKNKENAK